MQKNETPTSHNKHKPILYTHPNTHQWVSESMSEGSYRVQKLVNNKSSSLDRAACMLQEWPVCDMNMIFAVHACVCVSHTHMQMCLSVLSMATRWIIYCLVMKQHLDSQEYSAQKPSWPLSPGLLQLYRSHLLLPSFPVSLSSSLFSAKAAGANTMTLWENSTFCRNIPFFIVSHLCRHISSWLIPVT